MNRIPDFSTIEPNIKFAIVSSSFRKIVRYLACQSGVLLMYLMYAFKEVMKCFSHSPPSHKPVTWSQCIKAREIITCEPAVYCEPAVQVFISVPSFVSVLSFIFLFRVFFLFQVLFLYQVLFLFQFFFLFQVLPHQHPNQTN